MRSVRVLFVLVLWTNGVYIRNRAQLPGGDKTLGHHILRNNLYGHGRRAGAVPVLEAAGVLEVLGVGERGRQGRANKAGEVRERPADVLLCQAQDVRTGRGAIVTGRVALDVGVVCPQAAAHMSQAAGERLGAAEGYVKLTCGRRVDVEELCRAMSHTPAYDF